MADKIEANKTYFFRVGNAQYIYGKDETKDKPYWHMKYQDNWAIDTGRNITESTMPGRIAVDLTDPKNVHFKKIEDEYTWFSTEEELFESLDKIGADNLDHIMWGLTPTAWIKETKMEQPIGYAAAYKNKISPTRT